MFLTRERITQNEKCKFMLIKDTSRKSARHFLQAIACLFLNENTTVKYLSYDMPCSSISKAFQFDEHHFKLFDAFSDLVNLKSSGSQFNYMSSCVLKQICDSDNAAVFIDSVSSLLYGNTIQSMYRSVHQFIINSFGKNQLVMLLHVDSHPIESVSLIESLSTTVLELLPTEEEQPYVYRLTVRHPSGKVTQEIWECQITTEGEFNNIKEILPTKANDTVLKQPDPTADLTFNLKLTEDEKEDREKVELPYTKAMEENTSENIGAFLEDDDDPDDDLDI